MNSAAIILAAGSSSRMGQSKQMLDIDGEPLLLKVVKASMNSLISTTVVVLGSNEAGHRKILNGLSIEIIHNEHWQKGMGNSLKHGIHHLLNVSPSVDAVIILVCDQPMLGPEHITNLLSAYQENKKPIIASRYLNTAGVPALFDKSYFNQLMSLPDSQGAKKIILEHSENVYEVDFPGGEIDLDTMKAYNAFRSRH